MIPKIIHQINLGGRQLPSQHLMWQQSWKKFNPHWDLVIWDEKKIDKNLKVHHPKILSKCKNFSEASDLLRFDILHQFGGLYIDTDFECVKSIDNLVSNKSFLIFRQNPYFICGAFIASEKSHAKIKILVNGIPNRFKTHKDKTAHEKFGPAYITEKLGIQNSQEDGEESLKKTVYPFSWKHKMTTSEVLKSFPSVYAIHHWEGSWKE